MITGLKSAKLKMKVTREEADDMDLITLALARKYTKDQLSGVNDAVEDA